MDTFTLRTITSRDFFTTDDGDRIDVYASRTVNSNGVHWINLRVGKDAEIVFDYGGSESISLLAVETVIQVLREVTKEPLTIPKE